MYTLYNYYNNITRNFNLYNIYYSYSCDCDINI